jgi:hypothetical protein
MGVEIFNRNKSKDTSPGWESFDNKNPFFERGRRILADKISMEDMTGLWQPILKDKSNIHSTKDQSRKKKTFLERLKNRSSKMSNETASTAASTWASTSSTGTPGTPGTNAALHSPTLTEELRLRETNMKSLKNPPPQLRMDDLPKRYTLADGEEKTKRPPLRPKVQVKPKGGDVLDPSNLEEYESFFIPPKSPSPKRRQRQQLDQREACMQVALEDFRETVTTSMNSAIHMWSRVQSVFFHATSPEEVEAIKRRMSCSPDIPHPTTVFIAPKPMPAEKPMVLESLADSLTNPTILDDAATDAGTEVSSLTEPNYYPSKPVPPLFRMRKPDTPTTTTPAAPTTRKPTLHSAPVEEIHVMFDLRQEDCIEFGACRSCHEVKEPYDEKDELDDLLDKGLFKSKCEPYIPLTPSYSTQTSEMSMSDRFRELAKQGESLQLLWASNGPKSGPICANQPFSEDASDDLDSVSC